MPVPQEVKIPTPAPSEDDVQRGVDMFVQDWMTDVIPYVHHRALQHFSDAQEFGGRDDVRKPLCLHAPLQISSDANTTVKNFKEVWNMQHCLDALTTTDLYEASGSIFWLDSLKGHWGDDSSAQSPIVNVNWAQLKVAKHNWGDAVFWIPLATTRTSAALTSLASIRPSFEA